MYLSQKCQNVFERGKLLAPKGKASPPIASRIVFVGHSCCACGEEDFLFVSAAAGFCICAAGRLCICEISYFEFFCVES